MHLIESAIAPSEAVLADLVSTALARHPTPDTEALLAAIPLARVLRAKLHRVKCRLIATIKENLFR